jgi:branched-subunit amino acid aminotransferase/4-amino-4-deoxychorismate lyase
MSKRGFRLFTEYTQPDLSALHPEEHAKRLIAEAEAAGIPISEITEEVGAIADAVAAVKAQRERYADRAKGLKHPTDVIGKAVKIMRIGTDREDTVINDGKDPAAKALGAKGGKKRAEHMTPERRAEIAKKAAAKRWGS